MIFEDDQAIENNDNIFDDFFSSPDSTLIFKNENVEKMISNLPNIIEFSKYAYSKPLVLGDAHSKLSDASEKDSVNSDDFKEASFLECVEENSEKHGLQWPNKAY